MRCETENFVDRPKSRCRAPLASLWRVEGAAANVMMQAAISGRRRRLFSTFFGHSSATKKRVGNWRVTVRQRDSDDSDGMEEDESVSGSELRATDRYTAVAVKRGNNNDDANTLVDSCGGMLFADASPDDAVVVEGRRKRIVRFVEELRRRSGGSTKMTMDLMSKCKFPILSNTSSESNFSSIFNDGDLCPNIAASHTVCRPGARMSDDALAGGNSNGSSGGGGDNIATTSATYERVAAASDEAVERVAERVSRALAGCGTNTTTASRSNSNATRSVSVNDSRLQRFAPHLVGVDGAGSGSVETSAKLAHESLSARYRCLCGTCHVVTGTKFFLVFYICLTLCGVLCGMVSALVWTLVPIFIIPMSVHAFWAAKPKYLYPFLIITIVHIVVCLLMAFIVTVFTLYNYEKLSLIIAQNLRRNYYFATDEPTTASDRNIGYVSAKQERALSLAITPYDDTLSTARAALTPSSVSLSSSSSAAAAAAASTMATSLLRHHFDYGTLTVLLVGITVIACILLAIVFAWQAIVISNCIEYFDFWTFRDEPPSTLSRASDRLLLTAAHADCSGGGSNGGKRLLRLNSSVKRWSSGSATHVSMPSSPYLNGAASTACCGDSVNYLNAPIMNGGVRESRILAVARGFEREMSVSRNGSANASITEPEATTTAHDDFGLCLSSNSAPDDSADNRLISLPLDSGDSLAVSETVNSHKCSFVALGTNGGNVVPDERLAAKLSDATTTTWIPSTTSDNSLTPFGKGANPA